MTRLERAYPPATTHTARILDWLKNAPAEFVTVEFDEPEGVVVHCIELKVKSPEYRRFFVCTDAPLSKKYPEGRWIVIDVPPHNVARTRKEGPVA